MTTAEMQAPPQALRAGLRTWGNFFQLRDHLFDQWQSIPFIEDSGLHPDRLAEQVDAYLDAHRDQPRVLQRAHAFRIVVTQGRMYHDPLDWFCAKVDHAGILRNLQKRWLREAQSGALKEEAAWCDRALELGIARAGIDLGHISPGWQSMFGSGLTGLLAQADANRSGAPHLSQEQTDFYAAVEICYTAAMALASRFADLTAGWAETQPEHAERLRAVSSVCRRVPADAPRTFHDVLQFSWFMHELIEMEGVAVRSMGHFDRTFYPYYRSDLDEGRLTREQAKELIQFFWMKWFSRTRGRSNGKNFVFGGQTPTGEPLVNDLTYLAFEAYEEMNAPDPKLSVRFLPDHPDELYRRVAEMIRDGHNSFVLMNDPVAVEAMVRMGKPLEDARHFLPIGCYEPAVDGKEVGCTMNIIVNLAKGVELALHDGCDPLTGLQVGPRTGDPSGFRTFEALYAAYAEQMGHTLSMATRCTSAHERAWPLINPSPLIAGTIDHCLARGKDVGQGGAQYNSVGCVGVGLANAADSLLAIKHMVFDQQSLSMSEFVAALDADYSGQEALRQYLVNRVPKWGNAATEPDALALRIADDYCARVHAFVNARGGRFQAALFSLNHRIEMGEATGALPDGRRARDTLSPNVGAMTGLDKAGVTALISSATRLDYAETPNGAVLDIMLHPTAVAGEKGLDTFVSLIKTFFAQGGYAIQFNVFDANTLRDAQRHPERYASLQIRVTGWSVFWNALSREEQDHFVARNFHTA